MVQKYQLKSVLISWSLSRSSRCSDPWLISGFTLVTISSSDAYGILEGDGPDPFRIGWCLMWARRVYVSYLRSKKVTARVWKTVTGLCIDFTTTCLEVVLCPLLFTSKLTSGPFGFEGAFECASSDLMIAWCQFLTGVTCRQGVAFSRLISPRGIGHCMLQGIECVHYTAGCKGCKLGIVL
jgi:hypothetical protein